MTVATRLRRVTLGYNALWSSVITLCVGSLAAAAVMLLGGRDTALSSDVWDGIRDTAFLLPDRWAIKGWGVAWVCAVVIALYEHAHERSTLMRRAVSVVPLASLWVMFCVVFGSYATSHHGVGSFVAVACGVVGIMAWCTVLALTGYHYGRERR